MKVYYFLKDYVMMDSDTIVIKNDDDLKVVVEGSYDEVMDWVIQNDLEDRSNVGAVACYEGKLTIFIA